jgi:large subunit ribosomal protein L23
MFAVEVDSVQVLNVKGKQKKVGRSVGQRSDWKKAYVKLKPGHDIEFSAT